MKFLSIFLLIVSLAFFTVNAQDENAEDTATVAEETTGSLLINLTTDDTWTAGMALGFAGRVWKKEMMFLYS